MILRGIFSMSLSTASPLKTIIRSRRSIKDHYSDQPVREELVRELLDDARWAPTHGMREPWRFIFVSPENTDQLAKDVSATYEENLQENRYNYLSEPNAFLIVIMEEPEKQKQWDENFGAVASFIQNFSLLAWEQNLGVCWKTNPHIYFDEVRELLNVKDSEKIVGFLHLGYFTEKPEVKERTPIEDKFTTYPLK